LSLELRFHPAATNQLFELYAHIANEGGRLRAGEYISRLEVACQRLADFPRMGRLAEELGAGLRSLAFERRAVIIYRVSDVAVEILGVYFGGRDIAALLGQADQQA
jgi:toxin ParE1/3/4